MIIRFQLNQKGTLMSEKKGLLNDAKSWIDNFAPLGAKQEHFKLLNKNFKSLYTHSGLIYYLHYCWAKELGCVLRPDMIFYTILSEINREMIDFPDEYNRILKEKKSNVIMQDDAKNKYEMDPEQLTDLIGELISDKNFLDIIYKTDFYSDVPFAKESRFMVFGKTGVPYFNFLTTLCGIQSVDIVNILDDWEKLRVTTVRLYKIINEIKKSKQNLTNDSIDRVLSMLKLANTTINTIIFYSFGIGNRTVLKDYNSDSDFFNDIFSYGKNVICGSGHDTYLVKGWIKNFYINEESDLYKFSPTLSYVPYINVETNRMFVQVSTLAYSNIRDNIAEPFYGKVTFEVLDQEAFKVLASHNRMDDNLDFLNKKIQNDNLLKMYNGFVNINFETMESNEVVDLPQNNNKVVQKKKKLNDTIFKNRFNVNNPSGLHYEMGNK